MKKVVILSGIVIILCTILTGCGTKENEVKSVEKTKEIASIDFGKSTIETEIDNGNETVINEENTNEEEIKTMEQLDAETISVTYMDINTERVRYMIVNGYNNLGERVWEYTTKKVDSSEYYYSPEYICETNEYVLLNEFGELKALDIKTGKEVWTNSDFKGTCDEQYLIDGNGTIYLYCLPVNELILVDKNGKTVNSFKIPEYESNVNVNMYEVLSMEIQEDNDNKVIINELYHCYNEQEMKDFKEKRIITIDVIANSVNVEIMKNN